jgi:hypothetical protein
MIGIMRHKFLGFLLLLSAWQAFSATGLAATVIASKSATPATITFYANNPDSPSVTGNATATITFTTNGGSYARTWNVRVQATSANFASCPSTVPISRVAVTCGSVSITGGNSSYPGSGVCSASSSLSTSLRTVASGMEANNGSGYPVYTIRLTFTFLDSWGYIAVPSGAPCTVDLNYLITAN